MDLFDVLLGGAADEEPIGPPRGAPDRCLRAAADEDRDRLRRAGPDAQCRQVVDRAVVRERLAGPGLRQDLEDLLHRRTPPSRVGAEPAELRLRPAQPEAQDQPAVAEQLDGRRILGQPDRMVERGQDDALCRARSVEVAWASAAPTTRSDGMYPSSTKWCSVVHTDV